MRPILLRPRWRRLSITAVLLAVLLSCGQKQSREPSPLSSDELYLVDAYLRVRRAGSFYPHQRAVADSLLTLLAADVDTIRVAQTIAALNARPERWAAVLQTIEDRLSGRDSTDTSESSGR